jgi:hypothetical protein
MIAVQDQSEQTVHNTLSWIYPSQKRAIRVAQGVDPELSPQYHKNKTKQNKKPFSLFRPIESENVGMWPKNLF